MRLPTCSVRRGILVALICGLIQAIGSAAAVEYGDILVADPDHFYHLEGRPSREPAIWHVDPLTGDRQLITGRGRGSGPGFVSENLVWDPRGRILITDAPGSSILAVDPLSGDRTVVSSHNEALGHPDFNATAIAAIGPDALAATDQDRRALFHIDLATGARSILSGSGVGTGPDFNRPYEIAAGPSGEVYVIDIGSGDDQIGTVLMAVDPTTGNRRILYGDRDTPGAIGDPHGLTVLPNGDVLVRVYAGGLVRVDPETGLYSTVATTHLGQGPQLEANDYVSSFLPGRVLLSDQHQGALFDLDLRTGARRVLSGVGVGSGPAMESPLGMTVVIPEPSAGLLSALGCGCAGLWRSVRSGKTTRARSCGA